MATAVENYEARRDAIAEEIAEISALKAGGKPNQSGGGLSTDHQQYLMNLYSQLEMLESLIARHRGGFSTSMHGDT